MEQKTINQNKPQTILCIIALMLGVLVSVVLFSMHPVHAATVTPKGSLILESSSGDYLSTAYTQYVRIYSEDSPPVKFASLVRYDDIDKGDSATLDFIMYTTDIDASFTIYPGNETQYTDTSKNPYMSYYEFSSTVLPIYTLSDGTKVRASTGGLGRKCYSITPYCPMYNGTSEYKSLTGNDQVQAFLEHLLITGDIKPINKADIPNTTDEAYTFTGFSINGKTARWTGTTERSYLKDQEVEEYTTITYAWATTTEPDNIGSFQEYDGEFPTSDKQLKLPWSDMESGKVDFQFIRQVNITPCYRVPGAFYHGQAVKIFFKPDGTVDKIEQVTIPSDSETIGNDISLIGFRYDSSFHAEWVDVWSNGTNKSAFDLSGSQYLSLGIKAVYYDGSKIDIDFFPLDRTNLTWDRTFSDFKENNGSPIKSLYFTPYAKTGVNNPWNKGNSTVVNFDENGNPSSSFDTGDDGTVHLNDFKLTGVVWNKPVVQSGTITWTGTTPNSDLLFIPDSDTLVVATYPRYDSDMNTSYETWSTTTIGKGSMKVNVDYLIDYYKNSELAWNGEMWLTPCYKKGGVLYMGEPVIINCLKGTVSDIVVDEDSGKVEQVDKTNQNRSDADSILNVGNQFYSIINGLIGSLQQLPALLTAIFGFLPSSIINLIYASFAVIIICRILGR